MRKLVGYITKRFISTIELLLLEAPVSNHFAMDILSMLDFDSFELCPSRMCQSTKTTFSFIFSFRNIRLKAIVVHSISNQWDLQIVKISNRLVIVYSVCTINSNYRFRVYE